MQRFVLQQNIDRFRARLAEATDGVTRKHLRGMLLAAERDLALLNSALAGAHGRAPPPASEDARREQIERFRKDYALSPKLAALYDPAPGLPIAAVNETFVAAVGRPREQIEGQPLFLVFPDNPDLPEADGVSRLYGSLRQVAETGRAHAMDDQRYDVRNADGRFEERWWRPVNTPLFDAQRRLVFILHVVDEVTDEVLARKAETRA